LLITDNTIIMEERHIYISPSNICEHSLKITPLRYCTMYVIALTLHCVQEMNAYRADHVRPLSAWLYISTR
jgi:hypothetical protein